MIAAHCCYSELPKSLDFLASIYTDVPYWKDYNNKDDTSTWVYNCKDCIVTFQLAFELKKEMKELEVFDYYNNHCQPLMLSLTEAGNRGVLIDKTSRDKQRLDTEAELLKLEDEIETFV